MTWITVKQPGPDEPALGAALADARAGYPAEYSPAGQAQMGVPEPV